MAPKQKITREQIEEGAFSFVRENGAAALKARDLSQYLHCSTQPIFSNFPGMSEVRQCVISRAFALCDQFLKTEETGMKAYLDMGFGYLRFANQEKNLFRLLFLSPRDEFTDIAESRPDTKASDLLKMITGDTDENIMQFHMEMWVAVHGIASLLCTGYIVWEDGPIGKMLNDIFESLEDRYNIVGK